MNSEVDASYRLTVNSESSDIMDDPSVSILDVVSYFIPLTLVLIGLN